MQQYNNFQEIFAESEGLFNKGYFREAFERLEVLLMQNISDTQKADILNMLGCITLADPTVQPNNESGVNFFRKAIHLDEKNIGALLNIVENFGNSISNHSDKDLFDFACRQLEKMLNSLSDQDIDMIRKKQQLLQRPPL